MTKQQVEQIKADFVEWSGGFGPEECTQDEVAKYLEGEAYEDDRAGVIWRLHAGRDGQLECSCDNQRDVSCDVHGDRAEDAKFLPGGSERPEEQEFDAKHYQTLFDRFGGGFENDDENDDVL